jgi:hypothetical protein
VKNLLVLALFLFWSQSSSAYIDPISGGLGQQLLIVAISGLLYLVYYFRRNIKESFLNIFKK